jgi:hypothetical protein
MRFHLVALALVAACGIGVVVTAAPYVASASLLARVAGLKGAWAERLAGWRARAVTTEPLEIPARGGQLRARLYRPAGSHQRTIVLSAGVNPLGLDEPRLAAFARGIAQGGVAVVTPELPDLVDFRVTPRLTDQIEDVARWAAARPDLAPDGRVGLVGVSFSGGLSVVAAGRPGVRDRIAFVVSLGGHGDLLRTLRFLSTGILPDGSRRTAHDYGLTVALHNVVPGLVPPDQVEPLRAGLRRFLLASTVYMTDQEAGHRMYEEAVAMERGLPEPSRRLLHCATTRDVTALGPLVIGALPDFASDPALSPERSPAPAAPVFLLHGEEDNVIPATETASLSGWLARQHTSVRALVTPLVSHAEVQAAPTIRDALRLIAFWAGVVRR